MKLMHLNRRLMAPLAVALAFATSGCDDMLVENPAGTLTPVNFYQSSTDALTALNAVYSSLRYYNNVNWTYMVENSTPQAVNRRDRSNTGGCWDVFACNASNPASTNAWRDMYEGINRANAVIDNVPNVEEMSDDLRGRVIAEAKFLRALQYFNLVRLFGGVPLFEVETVRLSDIAKERSSADAVFDLIVADLTAAIPDLDQNLPASEFGRATPGAARALLGKVYLHRAVAGQSNPYGDPLYWPSAQPGDLDAAIAEFRAVAGMGYGLVDDYGSLWRDESEVNSEVIFAIRNAPIEGAGSHMNTYVNPLFAPWGFRQFAAWWGEVPFFESYQEGDVRKEATWVSEFIDVNGIHVVFDAEDVLGDNYGREGPAPRKYIVERDGFNSVNTGPTDFVLLRYADVMLSLAEALWRQNPGSGEALGLVNQIRDRADLDPLGTLTEEALYWERNWELATEQHGWFDAPRFWGLYLDHMMASASLRQTQPEKYDQGQPVPTSLPEIVEPKIRLMPIPQAALDLNTNLVQNPGY
jgi:starch-binding outer membrane protein, SusD/RagB family